MEKDFDAWNSKKKLLEEREVAFFFKSGDIWWCSVGLNVCAESCGKGNSFHRPVLVLKKLSRNSFIGIPLSARKKEGSWFAEIAMHEEKRYALLYQIRMFSTNRFQRRIATLEKSEMDRVKEKLDALLELSIITEVKDSGSVGIPKSNLSIPPEEVGDKELL